MKANKVFYAISRLLLLSLFAIAWIAPPAYASTIECVDDEGAWDCSLDVDGTAGIDILFTLTETTTLTFTTFTALTCDDHGTGQNTAEFAGDPYLYLFNDSDTLLASDDDGAGHNDNVSTCWDAHLNLVDLPAGSYRINVNVWETATGVFSMDVTGLPPIVPEPTPTPVPPTPTPVPTPTPELTPTPTPTATPRPTPRPVPVPTQTPTPTPAIVAPPPVLEQPTPTPEPPELSPTIQATTPAPLPTPIPPTPTAPIVEAVEEESPYLEDSPTSALLEALEEEDIEIELIEDIQEALTEDVTTEEIIQLTDNESFEELPQEAKTLIVEAVNLAPVQVRLTFEEKIDVFSGDYSNYVQVGSKISVEDRKTVIVAATAITVSTAAARIKPTATTGPTTSGPQSRRTRSRRNV